MSDDGVSLTSTAHPRAPWYKHVWFWLRAPKLSPDSLETIQLDPALHAAAPLGYKCSDCTVAREACPTCYKVWWIKRHPNIQPYLGGRTP